MTDFQNVTVVKRANVYFVSRRLRTASNYVYN